MAGLSLAKSSHAESGQADSLHLEYDQISRAQLWQGQVQGQHHHESGHGERALPFSGWPESGDGQGQQLIGEHLHPE